MTEKGRKWLFIFLLLVPVALLLTLALLLIIPALQSLPPIEPLPNPNGYELLVKAANSLPDSGLDYDKINQVELQKAVSANAAALSLARSGLGERCSVPVRYSSDYFSNHLDHLAGLKQLARAFGAEGRLAEMENFPDRAAASYLDEVNLGIKSAQGGILVDQLVATAIEAHGTRQLEAIAGRFEARTCREAAATLEAWDAQRQSWPEILQQESAWSRRAYPRLRDRFAAMMMANSLKKVLVQAGQKFAAQQLRTRKLLLWLATRAYELDKSIPPTHLTDLVPNYLKAVPLDPATGASVAHPP